MPQPKNEIARRGVWPALKADVTAKAKEYPEDLKALVAAAGNRQTRSWNIKSGWKTRETKPHEILESIISLLVELAVHPNGKITRATVRPEFLIQCFRVAPDLTLAVMAEARRIWWKSGKAKKIWRWMASKNGNFLVDGKERNYWDCTDDELTMVFIAEHPESADKRDIKSTNKLSASIVKARNKLAEDVKRGHDVSFL